MIKLNAIVTIKPYFNRFAVYRVPLAGNTSSRFQLAKMLSSSGIAYAYPYMEYLYFKGDPGKTLEIIREVLTQKIIKGKIIPGSNLKPELRYLTFRDAVIIKPIIYSAFEKILISRGFQVLHRIKRAIPIIDIEENRKKGLIMPLTNNVLVLRGLKYMFEVRPSGYGILWLDVYSPPYDRQKHKRMSPKEIRSWGMMDQYRSKAALRSGNRLKVLQKMLDILSGGENINFLTLKFPGGECIQFFKELIELEIANEEW